VWTHSQRGLSNDFILAAKIDALDVGDLLSKRQEGLCD
jgi:pterin-4a-carbinolamine dehydratase